MEEAQRVASRSSPPAMDSHASTPKSDTLTKFSRTSKRHRTKSPSRRHTEVAGRTSPCISPADEKHGNHVTDPVESMSTVMSSPASQCASPVSPVRSPAKRHVTSSGQRDQAKKDETQEETLRPQPAAAASPQEPYHSAALSPATSTKLGGNDTVPVISVAERIVSKTKPDSQLAAKTSPVLVGEVAPTSGTPPVAPLPEAVPSADTTAAAPDTACGTRKPCEKASTTSTHSGPGTSRASRPSAASVGSKRHRTSGGTNDCVLTFLSYGACAVFVVGTLLVVLFLLFSHSAREYIQSSTAKVEQYCNTKDCELHAQLILSKVNMNEDPCEDLNAFACSYWEPQADSYDYYGAALDAQAIHDWFTLFKQSLVEGRAHLMAGTKALAMLAACLWRRTTTEDAELAKRKLREFMTELRIPWPDEPRADVDPLGVLIDLSFRWQLGLWFELQPLQLQPRSESPPQPDLPNDGATSKRSTESNSRRPLLMSVGRFVGYWSVHNSETVHRRNYAKYWATFYEAFSADRPNKSDEYVQQVASVGRDVREELLGVVNNENKEPARFQLSDIGNHTPNLPARRWIEQLNANAVSEVASAADNAGNRSGYASNDTLTVTDTALLRAVNRLFGAHNSTMLLRHLSWFFIQASGTVFGALADRHLLAKYGDNRKASVRRQVFCATEVEDAYGPLVRSLYVVPRFTGAPAHDRARHVITQEAVQKVSALEWADSATRLAATTKLRNARTALWPPDDFLTNEVLNEMYANFATNLTYGKSLFIDYWIDAQRRLRALYDDPSLRHVLSLPPNYVLPYFDYDYLQNRVLISVAALHGALRRVQATPAVVYGGLGFSYARQLLRALDSGGLKIDADGNIVPDTWASPRWMEVKRERQ
ncbi:hypothetical protein HPB49_016216 [Dermacentor silvarum]|uniref:Uncharacterized protein n=1 Tax=Dermacentor silvarum TaxID=543639 RepID=A0ACB8CAA5_DERSI|nr:hypothetical protein HPB49_016216 [Dermacentor silvarum]